jgi:hypothetical protein
VLLFLFSILTVLALYNFILAGRLGRLKQTSILTFYVSAVSVLVLRVLLFMDPLIGWGPIIYVDMLISMPTCLYLITGLSQVMLSVECVVKYRNLAHSENTSIIVCERSNLIERNLKILKLCYIAIFSFMALIVLYFLCTAVLPSDKCITSSYSLVLPIGIFNLMVWTFLMVSTISFVNQINERFSGHEYKFVKNKLIIILGFFSMSFLLRGLWNFLLYIQPFSQDSDTMGMNDACYAVFLFFFYTICDWLPLCVIFS